MTQLPDKMSELIDVALAELAKCEKDDRYKIDMGVWHFPRDDGACHVCLAGAVMAGVLGVPIDESAGPEGEGISSYKLEMLDQLRIGDLSYAANLMGIKLPLNIDWHVVVTDYRKDPKQFHSDMEAMADMLRGYGL